jgi:hypothetical protein
MRLLDGLSRFNRCVAQLTNPHDQLNSLVTYDTGHNVRAPPHAVSLLSSYPKAQLKLAGKTASGSFHQSGTGRSDADHPLHAAHHALLACASILARQTQDPRSRLRAPRHSRRNNDRVRVRR